MKFTCLQENLSKGLQIVSKAVPTKGSLPVLTNILFSAENGKLKLSATNLETAISTYVPCSITAEGAVTVPAKLMRDFVSNLSEGQIKAETAGSILILTSDKTKSRFNGIAAEEFPEIPAFPENDSYIELDSKTFGDAVAYAAFASGSDDSRPMFTGIFINCQSNVLTVASTDGFRLSEKILRLEKTPSKEFTTIIPAKTLLEVTRVLASVDTTIKFVLHENENLALFQAGETTIATRILDGQYPEYKRIIPSETTLSAYFSTNDFVEAVKLTNVFAKEGNNALKVRFDPEGVIRITSLAEEAGEHESELKAEIEGELLEIAFNAKYLLDYLNTIKSQNIKFATKSNLSPCVFKSEENNDFIHIIMPMQI